MARATSEGEYSSVSDTNPLSSVVDSRSTPIIERGSGDEQGGGSQSRLVSRPSGTRTDRDHLRGSSGAKPSPLQQPSGHRTYSTRSRYSDDRRPSPQPHEQGYFRPQSDPPVPGAVGQTMRSQGLENEDAPIETVTQREAFVQTEPLDTAIEAFGGVHGLFSSNLPDRRESSPKRQEEITREAGASLMNVPTRSPPRQTALLDTITAHELQRGHESDSGVALTERDRQEGTAEERERTPDDFQRQQLEVVQNGSKHGSQSDPGLDFMITNLRMMGMNPMTSIPQQVFVAQQAAVQAYQQAMISFGQNVGQS